MRRETAPYDPFPYSRGEADASPARSWPPIAVGNAPTLFLGRFERHGN
jgi:hypothetical protein